MMGKACWDDFYCLLANICTRSTSAWRIVANAIVFILRILLLYVLFPQNIISSTSNMVAEAVAFSYTITRLPWLFVVSASFRLCCTELIIRKSSNLIAREYDQVQVPAHMVFKSGADALENVQCIDVLRNMCTVLNTDVT